jgi:ABC-type microcin C transport system permease subunit YejB
MRISIRYFVTSLLTIIPTLFGIMLITFILIQFAPGEPIMPIPLAPTPAQKPLRNQSHDGANSDAHRKRLCR